MKKRYWFAFLCAALALVLTLAAASADTGDEYRLIKDVSGLHDGDRIILVSDDDEYYQAMATDFSGVQVTVTSNAITEQDGMLVLTLAETEGGWYFAADDGYLAADGSSLILVTDQADATTWSISIASDGVATISCAEGNLIFAEHDGAYRFSCGTGGNEIAIYNATFEPDQHAFGDGLWWTFRNGKLTIGGSGDMPYFVSADYQPWALIRSEITEVEILDGVTRIGNSAFSDCTGLTRITMPCSAYIGSFSFSGCTSIIYVHLTIGDGTMRDYSCYNTSEMGGYYFSTFYDKTPWYVSRSNDLTVILDEGIHNIGNSAFYNCTGLQEITIPDSVTSIGYQAFHGTGWWNEQDDGLIYFHDILFGVKGTYGQIARIKEGTRLIAGGAFSGKNQITKVTIPDSVISIDSYAFDGCTSLTSITIPDRVVSIGDWMFYGCTGLESAAIGDSVTNIGRCAFYNCTALTSVTIGNSVKNIYAEAFMYCSKLTDVYYHGTKQTKSSLSISWSNGYLTSAQWHYLSPVSIEMKTLPNKLTYLEGESLDLTGGAIITYYDYDIVEEELLTTDMVSGFDSSVIGAQTLTVTFDGQTTTFDVTVSHVPGEPVIENEAPSTCTEAGHYDEVVYCVICGEELNRETVTVNALGHDLVHHDAQDPTCTEMGWEAYDTCSRCDYTTYVEIPALGHDLIHHDAQEPTCTEIGWEAYDTCSRCDYTSYVEIPALGHDLIHHDAQEPTCTEIGWEAYDTCSRCDYTTYVEIPALGHDLIHHDAQEPTCTEIGWEAYDTCSRCDYTTYVEIPALGHDLVHHDAKAPTCTEIGWEAYDTCSRCDYTSYVEIPALGHDLIRHDAQEPTCTEIGWEAYDTCSRCDYTTYVEIPALGHDLVHHDAKNPTCTEIGWDAYDTCSRCDYTTYKEIPALGHDLIHHDAQDPTCTEIGWEAYDTCSRCDYTTYVEIPALGHDLIHHDAKAPTCTEIGWEAYDTCTRCDYTTYVELPALGHDLIHHDAQEPTCTEIGWEAYDTCTRCDYTTYVELPALGHAPGEPVIENEIEPTYTTEGSYDEVVYCTRCGAELERHTHTVDRLPFEGTVEWNAEDVKFKGSTPYVIANGNAQTPRFTVKNSADGSIVDPEFYDYEYCENTNAGTGYVIVTFKGDYEGTCRGSFKIYLQPTTTTTIENVSNGIKLTWSPVPGAAGYVIYRRAWSSTTNGWTTFERWNNTTGTTYIDGADANHKVYAGTRYQYSVKAYFARRTDPVSGATIGGNVGDNFNLGEVGPLKTTVRITTRTLNSVTAGTKQMTVKWAGSSVFTGYQIQYATNSAFTQNAKAIKISNPKTVSTVIKSLTAGKTYYVRVRSYHEFNGMTYFGEWSNVKSCKVK